MKSRTNCIRSPIFPKRRQQSGLSMLVELSELRRVSLNALMKHLKIKAPTII